MIEAHLLSTILRLCYNFEANIPSVKGEKNEAPTARGGDLDLHNHHGIRLAGQCTIQD